MTNYNFLATRSVKAPTEDACRAFTLQQAAQYDEIASSWEGRDDQQAESWRNQAALLRRGL